MKKKQDDLQYIENRFQAENVTPPSSLSEQAVFDKLNRKETEKHPVRMPRSKRKIVKSMVAVAACFAIMIATGTGAYAVKMSNRPRPMADMTGVSYFTSYRQLKATMKEIDRKNNYHSSLPFFSDFRVKYAVDGDMAVEESSSEAYGVTSSQAKTGSESTAFAETNRQVEAVDEADIIKTDAHYLYYLHYGGKVKIYAAGDGAAQWVSDIAIDNSVTPEEMYLLGDTLIVVGTHGSYYPYDDEEDYAIVEENAADTEITVETTAPSETETTVEIEPTEAPTDETVITDTTVSETTSEPMTEAVTEAITETATAPEESPQLAKTDGNRAVVLTYDITDRTSPVLTDIYEQSGTYQSSRVTGGTLYLVSYDYNDDNAIPQCGKGGTCENVPIEDIVAIDGCNATGYAVVGAVSLADGESTQTKAVLGIGNDIYCNENNLYLFGAVYQYLNHYYQFDADVQTQIVKYALDGTEVTLTASARVDGTTDNQFSLDEKDGYLRIATTSTNSAWQDTNNLYVLDDGLNVAGKVTGFANNEHIEAVRYVGDTAYVITFERTDPLFIIDLSDPNNPVITGEVKIDGFSTFLTPVDENTLLGIGYYTEENEFGGVFSDGLKLALFDVSDKNNPRVLDEASFPNAYSAAQQTHKALVHNSEKGYYAIPLTVDDVTWNEYGEEIPLQHQYDNGILQFTLDDGRFSLKNLQAAIEPQRCTFIGDYLYAVDANGETVVTFPTE